MDQKEQNSEKKVYTDETIGKVVLDLSKYPGEDFYCDGESEEELLKITRDLSTVEYAKTIEEKASWPIFYHLSPQRENVSGTWERLHSLIATIFSTSARR